MFHKTPNYLKWILIALAVMLVLFIVINLMPTNFNLDHFQNDGLKKSGNNGLVSKNLISYREKETLLQPKIYPSSPILGNPNAPISIFEYSSFGCPLNKKVQPIIKELLKKYPESIKLIWKDLPLEKNYSGANLAHQAARCAGRQGNFWQYHDQLWEQKTNLSNDAILKIADDLNLNQKQFSQCLKDSIITADINQDIADADALLISGVPHFYINSQELVGVATQKEFEQLIEVELNR